MIKVPVLAFHDISTRSGPLTLHPKKFQRILGYFWKKGYASITISTFLRNLEQKNYDDLKNKVIFTFDDAYESVLLHALPMMRKYGFTGNIFITTKYIGKTTKSFATNPNLPEAQLLSKTQIKKLTTHEWEAHAHSHSHNTWQLNQQGIQSDMKQCKRILANEYVTYPKKYISFCYPKNRITPILKESCDKQYAAGFAGGQRSFMLFNDSIQAIPRIELKNTLATIALRLFLLR